MNTKEQTHGGAMSRLPTGFHIPSRFRGAMATVLLLLLCLAVSQPTQAGSQNTAGQSPTTQTMSPAQGKYVLRATQPLRDKTDYKGFCTALTANLNEFRRLDFNTCHPRLSTKYPRFSRPKWEEIPLDLDVAKKILTGRPSVGFERWYKITESARAASEVKLWRIKVDLLRDGNLETLVRLDHASDGTQPHCSNVDSKQMIVDIPNLQAAKRYAHAGFNNLYRLGGDMIHDADTKRYYVLDWNRYGGSVGGGITLGDIGATASVMVSGADEHGIWPICRVDWLPTGRRK